MTHWAKLTRRAAPVSSTANSWAEANSAPPRITVTLRWRASESRPPVSRATTEFFQSRSFSASTCGAPKRTPQLAHRVGVLDHSRGVEQRLRRNAAHVETHAAQRRVALDQRHRESKVRRAKRGRVAARARPEHHQIEIVGVADSGRGAGTAGKARGCPAPPVAASCAMGRIGTVSR
jgi:hypothetical protein